MKQVGKARAQEKMKEILGKSRTQERMEPRKEIFGLRKGGVKWGDPRLGKDESVWEILYRGKTCGPWSILG